MRYDAVVGMTETFSESRYADIEHVLGHIGTSASKEEEVKGLFFTVHWWGGIKKCITEEEHLD